MSQRKSTAFLDGNVDSGASKRDPEERLPQKITRLLKRSFIFKQKWMVKCELAVVIVLVFIVWGLLSLPIVFYYTTQSQGNNETNSEMGEETSSQIQNDTISQILHTMNNDSGTINDTDDIDNRTHTCFNKYTGTHCLSVLQELSRCESSGRSDVFISNFIGDQNEIEEDIGTLLFVLEAVINPSDECKNEVVPFFCLYNFGLCGENSADYRPTVAECSNIRDSVCESEWKKANDLLESRGLPPLPDCSSFSDDGLECEVKTLNDTPCIIECHDHFYCENNFCKPRCDRFREFSDEYVILSDVLMILSGSIGLLCGIVVVVIFVIRYKTMMIFPTILVFYTTISLIFIEIIILIAFMDRSALFCNSIDLLDSLDNPTPFCKLTGIVEAYVIIHATMWWIFHIFAIFWKVQFPFHSRYFDNTKRTKYIHATCVVLALILPILPAVLISVEGGFITPRFPPIVCIGRESASNFYGIVFPITLMYAVGASVLLAILWRIRRHMRNPTGTPGSSFHFSAAESKIFIVFVYYLFSGALQLTTFSIANKQIDHDVDAITSYFNCQRSGNDSECSLDTAQSPVWALLALVVLLLFPAINFVYVIRASDVKMVFKLCSGLRRIGIKSESTIGTSSLPSSKQVQEIETNDTHL